MANGVKIICFAFNKLKVFKFEAKIKSLKSNIKTLKKEVILA